MTITCTCDAQLQPHDRLENVCPPIPCDDCHRADGTHDLEVEH